MTKKCTHSTNELNANQKWPFIIYLYPGASFIFAYISFSIFHLVPVQPQSATVTRDFLSVYGSPGWTDAFWRIQPVHQMSQSGVINPKFYLWVCYFTESSDRSVWLWYSLEVNQYLSYNPPPTLDIFLPGGVCTSSEAR